MFCFQLVKELQVTTVEDISVASTKVVRDKLGLIASLLAK